jgi:hypothetical protein
MDMLLGWLQRNFVKLIVNIFTFLGKTISSKKIWKNMITIVSKIIMSLFSWMADNWGKSVENMRNKAIKAILDIPKKLVEAFTLASKEGFSINDLFNPQALSRKVGNIVALKLRLSMLDPEKDKEKIKDIQNQLDKFSILPKGKDWDEFNKKLNKNLKGTDLGVFLRDVLKKDFMNIGQEVKDIWKNIFKDLEKLPQFKTSEGKKALEKLGESLGFGKKKEEGKTATTTGTNGIPVTQVANAMQAGTKEAFEAIQRGSASGMQQEIVNNTAKTAKATERIAKGYDTLEQLYKENPGRTTHKNIDGVMVPVM